MKKFHLDDFSLQCEQEDFISSLYEGNSIHLELVYSSDFINAKFLREIVDVLCKNFGVSPKWRTRIVLIVDELNNNAIEYGSKKNDKNILNLYLHLEENNKIFFRASVSDTGTGSHAKNASYMEDLRKQHVAKDFSQHDSIRGRGLFLIISRLVDSLYFEDSETGGLKVIVEKSLLLQEDL